MQKDSYSASKTRSNRPGWSISFRHPLRNDARGKPGLKMRRGLGTSDDGLADSMVSEMNKILGEPRWWNAAKRTEAAQRFSKPVVEAFYDEIQAGRSDPQAIREAEIPLPTKADGYSRVLFVGTTGAGKTSLLRQLIGSDPETDRFPSTAPAKTTIADIEVIQAECDFEAIVTFFTEFQIQANIEECVIDACMAVYSDATIDKVAERLLNHRDQKFRLSYVLGGLRDSRPSDEDELSFDADETFESVDEEEGITDAEREKNKKVLERYLARVTKLTRAAAKSLENDLGIDVSKATGQDREAAEQIIEENLEALLQQQESFHELVQDILDDVRSRFDIVQVGELRRGGSGWPESWLFRSDDRRTFVEQIRWFSSNHWPQFGRLLTPLVEGIRVKGPFFPTFASGPSKIALIDGQGLGHTPDSSASVTTHVTKRFGQVDVILIVDNAQQPMQAAPLSVLRTIAASGHHQKLAIAFTHFDQIKGKNLPTFAEKRTHVMASVLNALSNLKEALGAPIVRTIEHGIDERCFMLGAVDRAIAKLPTSAGNYMREQYGALIRFCERAILPPAPPKACPIYDPTGISFAVQDAVNKFQQPWLARLGLATYSGIDKAHWSQVKALNRRIAGELDIEYGALQPVADFVARLSESISRFLDSPISWTRNRVDEQEEQAAIANIRRAVSANLHEFAIKRLVEAQLETWRLAYGGPEYLGTGSTFRRARAIRNIYDEAAPLPDAAMTTPSAAFLAEVRRIVVSAIEGCGGEIRLTDL